MREDSSRCGLRLHTHLHMRVSVSSCSGVRRTPSLRQPSEVLGHLGGGVRGTHDGGREQYMWRTCWHVSGNLRGSRDHTKDPTGSHTHHMAGMHGGSTA